MTYWGRCNGPQRPLSSPHAAGGADRSSSRPEHRTLVVAVLYRQTYSFRYPWGYLAETAWCVPPIRRFTKDQNPSMVFA